MKEQVLIYEVKSAAAANAQELFSSDSNYFYWNETKFKNLAIGDFVFVVNRTNKWILFTKLEKMDIPTQEKEDSTIFNDKGKDFNVSGKWNTFIRLEIVRKLEIPNDWQWQSLGSSETTYLNGSRIGLDSAENRIKNINQLKQLVQDESIVRILDDCLLNFNGGKSGLSPEKSISIQKTKSQTEMNILTAIKTKPFVLLAGISGTGKSRLVRTLAYQSCNKDDLRKDDKKPGNFELIPVRPNWHDSSELLGYVTRINGEKYLTTTFLQFIAKAWKNLDVPFFLCLDEMNLAPVEQYFAEYLSIIETRQIQNNEIVTDFLISKTSFENQELYFQLLTDLGLNNNERFANGISIPQNLVVIGTVNMDETTHSFSRKVLDRAMTFEMNDVDLNAGLDNSKNDWSYQNCIQPNEVIGRFTTGSEVVNKFSEAETVINHLLQINNALEGTSFKIAYRVRDEFLIYSYYASEDKAKTDWLTTALDEMTCMKILPRIEGDETKMGVAIDNLLKIVNSNYPKSNKKLLEMKQKLQFGYTSFWS